VTNSDYHTLAADFYYEVQLLMSMFEQLPPKVSLLLGQQLVKVLRRHADMAESVRQTVTSELDDLSLCIKSQEFDLDATKREKKALEDFIAGLNS